jgi:hypothetical protein
VVHAALDELVRRIFEPIEVLANQGPVAEERAILELR